ncbi:GntR family transcriptional regulator [Salinifilum aidingensis]
MIRAAHTPHSAAAIAEQLRSCIRSGQLPPGTRLIQQHLAAELEVSRIPLREALHALAAEGLVEVHPRGMTVAELNGDDIAELFDLRRQLEPGLAEDVVRGCRDRDREQLQQLADRMRAQGADADARAAVNYRFHRHIYELADRRLTLRFVDQLLHLVEPYSRRWVRSGHDLQRIDEEHQRMVDALAARDAEALRQVITAHIDGARAHVLAAHQR